MITPRHSWYSVAGGVVSMALLGAVADQPRNVGSQTHGPLALQTCRVLYDLPTKGVDASAKDLEDIIAAHHRLAKSESEADQRLSLTVAGAVAYGLVTEIHRAESARLKRGPKLLPPSIPFDKMTLSRLWKANVPDFGLLLKRAVSQKDLITSYVTEHSSLEDAMSGKMAAEIKDDKVRERYQELWADRPLFPIDLYFVSFLVPFYAESVPVTPDMNVVQILYGFETLRNLSLVIDLYTKGDLPGDWRKLESMVEEVVKQHPVQRLSVGSPATAFGIASIFDEYYPKKGREYRLVLAGLLTPYADHLRLWPEDARQVAAEVAERRAEAAAEAAIKAPAQPPAVTNQVLAVAYGLVEKLKAQGYQYPRKGLPGQIKTINDKQFVLMVVEQLIPDLSLAAKTRILMGDLATEDVTADKNSPVRRGDPRTKGIQQALVDLGIGEVVPPTMAQPGDLVQYWVVGFGGQNICFGRVGVIERTAAEGKWRHAWFYGPNDIGRGGIGTWPEGGFELASEHITYVVRLKPPKP